MRSTTFFLTAALLIVGVAYADPGSSYTRSFVGYARALGSGQLVYTESHHERIGKEGGGELSTTYLDDSGEQIAQRKATFDDSLLAPGFLLTDLRSGADEGLRRENGRLVLHQRDPVQQSVKQRTIVPGQKTLVADAGFDRFIMLNWENLEAGERLSWDPPNRS